MQPNRMAGRLERYQIQKMKIPLLNLSRTLMFCAALMAFAANGATKPNVVLILVDDFGFECLKSNGSETFQTPNIDKLAATGMRFENCHVQPLCTPTRVQLMTAQYNIRNYIEFGYMEPKLRTFANLFHDAGYATAITGKWQLGDQAGLPKRWGFDEYCLWQYTRRPERYKNPGLEVNGKEVDYTKGEYGPDIVSDYALDFIARNKDKPFLLYYPMMLTHGPFVPTPDSPDYNQTPAGNKGRDQKYFADMVKYCDKLVGKLTAKLEELKIRENTLVLIVGDNGTGSGLVSQFRGQPYVGGKGKSIHTGTHVPLVASWPKTIPSAKVNSDLVDSTDFLPTICDAAGITVPKEMAIDGRSFWPQLQGKIGSPREWSYCWYAPQRQELKFEFAQDLNFKLYRNGAFFNLRADLDEKSALAKENLSVDAKASYAKLSKVLEDFKNARPARLSTGKIAVDDGDAPPKGKPQRRNKRAPATE
jgi:arylsulfatase A